MAAGERRLLEAIRLLLEPNSALKQLHQVYARCQEVLKWFMFSVSLPIIELGQKVERLRQVACKLIV